MKLPLVSVIVCTYNRSQYLAKCLDSLERQKYPYLEIIVVNGPSTDNTKGILKKYINITIINQENLNGLSFARNLGIKVGHGEIMAFIDDDAVADENWIQSLVEGYTEDSVGGVGGLVYGPNKMHYQFDNGVINRCGIPTAIRDENRKFKKDEFPIIMGTNCSFRKKALYLVDGYDPYFRYYHDESDLCVRIAKKGYDIVYRKDAFVIHDMVEGHNRKSSYDLNWQEIMKNIIYFILSNFNEEIQSYTIRPAKALAWWIKYFIPVYLKNDISFAQLLNIYSKLIKGAVRGYLDGLSKTNEQNNLIDNDIDKNRRIKVCLLSQEYSGDCNGGICRYTYDLAHGLSGFGVEVHIISKSEKNINYDYLDGKIIVHKVVPMSLNVLDFDCMGISGKNLSYSYSACLKILELIENYGIQVVEAPLWDAEGFVFSLVKNIPLVVRVETPLFKVSEIEKWQVTKDLKLANWMEGETARRADKIIAISNAIGKLISDHHAIPKEKIELCPLGIELPAEKTPFTSDEEATKFEILFVGRLEKRKGVEILLKAAQFVAERIPYAQFDIVGKDTNSAPNGGSYKRFLIDSVDKKYLKNIKFVGYVDNDKLNNYYKDCSIFVAPSLYESFGLIYLEAMAWGKPVIGCNVGGVPEVIDDGVTGILVPSEDEIALAKAIVSLSDKNLRDKMGKNGRKSVEDTFTINKMTRRTLEIYKEIIYIESK